MKNLTLLRTRNDFNEFTYLLLAKLTSSDKPVTVTMRNGLKVAVIYIPADEKQHCDSHFTTEDRGMTWNPDGSSVLAWDYDLIEIDD